MLLTTASLSFKAAASDVGLRLTVRLDDAIIYNDFLPSAPVDILHEFDDSEERDHILSLEMSGKLPEHTTVSETGDILKDSVIEISNMAFDEIELGHRFTEIALYCHDTNGTTAPVTETFYGTMGCNGRVEMRFSTPIYLWLLENL